MEKFDRQDEAESGKLRGRFVIKEKITNRVKDLDLNISDIDDISIDGIDIHDYPDFCDAYIDYASYEGVDLNDEELDYLTEHNMDYINERAALWACEGSE